MRFFGLWLSAVVLVVLLATSVGPLPAQTIQTGSADDFPLSDLKTFGFMQQDRKAPDGLAGDEETEAFIRRQLGEALVAAGFRPDDSAPDFVVAFYAKTYPRTSYRVLNRPSQGEDLALGRDQYEIGVLIVDFVSVQANQAVWRGRADKAVSQKNTEKVIRQACRKLVQQFQKDAKQQARSGMK